VEADCKRLARERGNLVAVEFCVAEKCQSQCEERSAFCPLYLLMKQWKQWGIPEREHGLLMDDLLGKKPLAPWAGLTAMRARVAKKPGAGGLKGTEALVVLGGKCGAGKTLAATWALSRTGGRYVTACEFTGISLDLATLKRANTLVIDQLGTEPTGESGWALGHVLDVVDVRYANLRLTVLCTNMLRETLETRYTRILGRRLHDDGVFIRLGDAS